MKAWPCCEDTGNRQEKLVGQTGVKIQIAANTILIILMF